MKIDSSPYGSYPAKATSPSAAPQELATVLEDMQAALKEAERRDQLLISSMEKEREKRALDQFKVTKQKFDIRVGKPVDSSARLTQRLVSANNESEVGSVISQASQSLTSLRLIAALGEGEDAKKAQAIIQKINRLLNRASGKIRDLRNEQSMQTQKKRAEDRKQDAKAEKIKYELRKKQKMRHIREGGYLREASLSVTADRLEEAQAGAADPLARLDGASEAEIAAQAEAMAAAEVSAESMGGGEMIGGEGGGEVSAGGGVDISV